MLTSCVIWLKIWVIFELPASSWKQLEVICLICVSSFNKAYFYNYAKRVLQEKLLHLNPTGKHHAHLGVFIAKNNVDAFVRTILFHYILANNSEAYYNFQPFVRWGMFKWYLHFDFRRSGKCSEHGYTKTFHGTIIWSSSLCRLYSNVSFLFTHRGIFSYWYIVLSANFKTFTKKKLYLVTFFSSNLHTDGCLIVRYEDRKCGI